MRAGLWCDFIALWRRGRTVRQREELGATYLDMMRKNLAVLEVAMSYG